ncbi:CLUMA_CG018103, isoform A [Clunio marinus]|uniref:CLUMA_CG018103, isoform A n=1 Tax=Clunio marinus TaxID=568069 RepID=A0A1J1J212_9DIPT|nr:CLUMA_CG018103, isoform A [Clunio marinus]
MWKIVLLTTLGFVIFVNGYASHNYDVLTSDCIEQARMSFKAMPKQKKIIINGKTMGYYGFSDSSTSVITLNISRSDVRIPTANMSYINMIVFDASYNGIENIDDIGNETFPSLKSFNLSHNALKNVHSHLFTHCKEIEILDLSYNCFIKFQPGEVFLQHENLKKLLLNNNRLHFILFTPGLPKVMVLEYLDISNNFLTEFSNDEVQIHRLEMKNNSLANVVIFHAENMILNAQHNKMLHFIAPGGNFKLLNLSHNDFSYISFVEVNEAKILDVSHNRIQSWTSIESSEEMYEDWKDSEENFGVDYIDEDASVFDKSDVQKVLHERVGVKSGFLNLASNNLSSIHDLRHFKNCIEMNLASNNLRNIDLESFRILFPMLKKVNLINNPLTSVDEIELKFFNSTRFLKLHFEYHSSTEVPKTFTLVPPTKMLTLPITTSTIISRVDAMTTPPMTTVSTQSIKVTSENHNTESFNDTTIKPVEKNSLKLWLLAISLSAIIVSTVIYIIYRRRNQNVQILRRTYNEAENYL